MTALPAIIRANRTWCCQECGEDIPKRTNHLGAKPASLEPTGFSVHNRWSNRMTSHVQGSNGIARLCLSCAEEKYPDILEKARQEKGS